MNNKVLVKIFLPDMEISYDVYLPISKRIGNIINLVLKSVLEMGIDYQISEKAIFYNRNTGERYDPNAMLIETNIRNGTELILI